MRGSSRFEHEPELLISSNNLLIIRTCLNDSILNYSKNGLELILPFSYEDIMEVNFNFN